MKIIKRKEKNISMIEIIIVVFLIGAITSLAMPNLKKINNDSIVDNMKNDIRVLEKAFLSYYKDHNKYPIKNKINIDTIPHGETLKEFMLDETNDDLSQIYSLDLDELNKYRIQTEYGISDYYYSAKSNQFIYPQGKINFHDVYIYNDYKNCIFTRPDESNIPSLKPDLSAIKTIFYGGWYNTILLHNDTVYQGGLGADTSFVKVPNLSSIVSTYTHYYTNFALSYTGELYVWGKVGDTNTLQNIPIKIEDIPPVKKVFSRFDVAFILTRDNRVLELDLTTLKTKDLNLTNIKEIAVEKRFALFLNNEGEVYASGDNFYGQLGQGNIKTYDTPVKVPNLPKIRDIAVGFDATYFISKSNHLYVAGRNDYGQLGLGYISNFNEERNWSVQKVNSLSNVKTIITNDTLLFTPKIMAIDGNDNLYSWGWNFYNDKKSLAETSPLKVSYPVKYEEFKGVKDAMIIGEQNFVLLKNGNFFSWGYDGGTGALGQGQILAPINYPKQIKELSHIIKMESGLQHSIVVDKSNNIYVWGFNSNNQLGVGDSFPRYRPVKLKYIK